MGRVLPILFNTEMVQAILDGRKNQTRRLIKPQPDYFYNCVMGRPFPVGGIHYSVRMPDKTERSLEPRLKPDDVLYVRETWRVQSAHRFEADARIEFKAGGLMSKVQFSGRCSDSHERPDYDDFIGKWGVNDKWHPSIHMPKEAARIFLRVTKVQPERLQDIAKEENKILGEGIYRISCGIDSGRYTYKKYPNTGECWGDTLSCFKNGLWNSTLNRSDLDKYGWDANPWVWVYMFEQIENDTILEV